MNALRFHKNFGEGWIRPRVTNELPHLKDLDDRVRSHLRTHGVPDKWLDESAAASILTSEDD